MEPYNVKWKLANEFNLIIAAVYQELFQLTYVEDLLELIKDNYIKTVIPNLLIKENIYKKIESFEEKFEESMKRWEDKKRKEEKKASMMRSFDETKKKSAKKGEENSSKTLKLTKRIKPKI